MLNEMTFGDESMIREILDQFVKDSRNDVEALHINIETRELEKVQEIMHRMAGRTGQIGARELSAKFRHWRSHCVRTRPRYQSLK
jgi:HPt (histidine-containing phosphotransfer) domain-containing protein